MHRPRNAPVLVLLAVGLAGLGSSRATAAREEYRSPLFVYLHELQPLEDAAAQARDADEAAEAYRLYLQALRGYERLDAAVGDWDAVKPQGLHHLVREGLARCEAAVAELRPAAERKDALLRRLNQPVNLDVEDRHVREVARLLTALTDVNIVVDDTLFPEPGPNPNVTLRVEREVPLLQVIRLLVQQKGLAYAIEQDYIYISSRTRVDGHGGFNTTAWFNDRSGP